MQPAVAIVIVTWNNYGDLVECLHSIQGLDYSSRSVVVVDNGCDRDLAAILREPFPIVQIVATGRNLGVPSGYNMGIERALAGDAEYVFILNDDTTLAPEMLSQLVDAAQQHPDAGILMPKVLHYDKPDTIWSAGARYRKFPPAIVFVDRNRRDPPNPSAPRAISFAPACGILVRRSIFEEVGLFDPGYFFFYEDMDFCERVRASGSTILYVPTARMWHKVSRTSRASSEVYWRVWGESSSRFYRQYGGPAIVSVPWHVGYLVARELVLGNARHLPTFLRGIRSGLVRPLDPPPGPRRRGRARPSRSATFRK